MSTVYTMTKSLHQAPRLYANLFYASKGDAIVLMDAAVLALASDITLASFSAKCHVSGIRLVALKEDLAANQISVALDDVETVDMSSFVDIVEHYDKLLAW